MMKTRLMIPALLAAATLSTGAFAHGNDRDNGHRGWQDHRQVRHHHVVRYAPPPVVYVQPRVYRPAPPVVYRGPAVYRPMPVAYVPAPPLPYPPVPSERTVTRAIGTVAGGVIGHQVGDGQLAPTLIGAVIGGVIGDQIAR